MTFNKKEGGKILKGDMKPVSEIVENWKEDDLKHWKSIMDEKGEIQLNVGDKVIILDKNLIQFETVEKNV